MKSIYVTVSEHISIAATLVTSNPIKTPRLGGNYDFVVPVHCNVLQVNEFEVTLPTVTLVEDDNVLCLVSRAFCV